MIPFVIAIAVIVLGLISMVALLLIWTGRIGRYAEQAQADLNLRALALSEKEQALRDKANEVALFARLASEMAVTDPDTDDTIQR